ncbi:MAG: substrate-binding domain-containing protein, partial [Planctomycetota bacterium]
MLQQLSELSRKAVCVVGLGASLLASGANAQVPVDPELPDYEPETVVAGSLKSAGSETMNNIVSLWQQTFQEFHGGVAVGVEGHGSSTAPPALTQGQVEFGQMSRPMKQQEVDKFKEEFGYEPAKLRTGIDCIAVFVHKDNPVKSLSLAQIERAFSQSGPDLLWGDLGVDDPAYRNRPVKLYGRNSASGTYAFFKNVALRDNDFKDTVAEQPGS